MMPTDTSITKQSRAGGRLAFVADLAFVLCTVWLVLWRIEMPEEPAGSIWASPWPALVVAGIVAAAALVGALQRKPRGFLPYALRWILFGALLVLPAWIGLSLIDAQTPVTPRMAANQLREEAQDLLGTTNDADDKAELVKVIEHAEAAEKLAQVLEIAEARDVAVPQTDLGSRSDLAEDVEAGQLPESTRKSFEQAISLAEGLDDGRGLPAELAPIAEEVGLSDAQLQGALIALAAVALAPALGLSAPLVEALLSAIVADGTLSLSGLLHVGLAVAMSTTSTGTISESKLRTNYERTSELGVKGNILLEALEKKGGDKVRNSEGFQMLKQVSKEIGGQTLRPCPKDTVDLARKDTQGETKAALKRRLKRDCPDLRPKDINAIVKETR